MEGWKIHKNRAHCERPGCPLAAEPEFYAILTLPECVRLERCAACFDEISRSAGEMPFHWKVRRTQAGSKPVLDLESLRSLFDRLGAPVAAGDGTEGDVTQGDEADEAAPDEAGGTAAESTATDQDAADADPGRDAAGLRYLVALLLLRKRRLKMVDPTNEEQERADLVVVDPKLPEMEPVCLHAPEFDPERLATLREELLAAIGEESENQTAYAEPE